MNILHRSQIAGLAVLAAACGPHWAGVNEDQKTRTDLQKQVSTEIERLRQSKKPSVSQGKLTKGTLAHAAELAAPEGVGYYLAHPTRGTHFGNDRLVFGLMELGVYLKEQLGDHPDHRLRIHDLSSKNGGKQKRHINHQMGLDVDLAFYATDLKGNVIRSIWTSYGADGKSKDGHRLFDSGRNWEVVAGIIKNEHFGAIRSILISNDLKRILLTYAHKQLMEMAPENETERAALEVLIKKAEVLMRQPKSSPHDNHFHLSLSNTDKP
jgi:murein endopeptidase